MVSRFLRRFLPWPQPSRATKEGETSQNPPVELPNREWPADSSPADCPESISAIIHRLSQPLTALRGSLELALLQEHSPEEYRRALNEALERADLLVSVLVSLRELAESGDPGDRAEHVLLGSLLKEAIEEMLPLAESRGVTLTLDSGVDLYVSAHPARLRQAICKVIHYAIERSADGDVVKISLSASDGKACLSVFDNGPAARPGELDYLDKPCSLGLLLSEALKHGSLEWVIAKRTFEAQGATIRLVSKVGGDNCFRACLPITQV